MFRGRTHKNLFIIAISRIKLEDCATSFQQLSSKCIQKQAITHETQKLSENGSKYGSELDYEFLRKKFVASIFKKKNQVNRKFGQKKITIILIVIYFLYSNHSYPSILSQIMSNNHNPHSDFLTSSSEHTGVLLPEPWSQIFCPHIQELNNYL